MGVCPCSVRDPATDSPGPQGCEVQGTNQNVVCGASRYLSEGSMAKLYAVSNNEGVNAIRSAE